MSPGLAIAALFALGAGQALDFQAGVRLETSTGKVPVVPDQPSRDITRFQATPSAGLTLSDHTYRLSLSYQPLIYFRIPNDLDRPLVFHQVAITHRNTLAHALNLEFRAQASRGEVDFGRASLLVGDGTEQAAVVPEADLIKSTNASGTVSLTQGLSLTDTLRFQGTTTYAKPSSLDTAYFGQFRAGLDGSYIKLMTRADELTLTPGFEWIAFLAPSSSTDENAANRHLAVAKAEARYRRFNARGFQLTAGAGVTAAVNTRTVIPVCDLGLKTPIAGNGTTHLSTDLSVGLQGFASPTTGTYDPRAFAQASFVLAVRPSFSLAVIGTFATPAKGGVPAMGGAAARAETVLSARVPLTYRLSNEVSLEAGLRSSTRAPRFSAPNFRFGQVEVVGYGLIIVALTTHNAVR